MTVISRGLDKVFLSGVYGIVHIITGQMYIGSSVNMVNRCLGHFKNLSKGTHGNIRLQRSWNKYGETAFVFIVIKRCSKKHLLKVEQDWIDRCGSYNLAPKAGSTLGLKWSARSCRKQSQRVSKYFRDPENRRKNSERMKEFAKQNPDFYAWLGQFAAASIRGTKRSKKTKKKMSEAKHLAWVNYTPEERTVAIERCRANISLRNSTPWSDESKAKVSATMKRIYAQMSDEFLSERSRKANATQTLEERTARAKKGWETRRARGTRWSARSRHKQAHRVSQYFSRPENRIKQSDRMKEFAKQNPNIYIKGWETRRACRNTADRRF